MKKLLSILLLSFLPVIAQTTVEKRISDSLQAHGLGADSSAHFKSLTSSGGVGFYGAAPVTVQCTLPYATPPNPVTAAQARAAYDLALQNCLDESGVGLVKTP